MMPRFNEEHTNNYFMIAGDVTGKFINNWPICQTSHKTDGRSDSCKQTCMCMRVLRWPVWPYHMRVNAPPQWKCITTNLFSLMITYFIKKSWYCFLYSYLYMCVQHMKYCDYLLLQWNWMNKNHLQCKCFQLGLEGNKDDQVIGFIFISIHKYIYNRIWPPNMIVNHYAPIPGQSYEH